MTDQQRIVPANELDYHMQMTDSVWGKANISPELKEKLKYIIEEKYKKGDVRVNDKSGELEQVNQDITVQEKKSLWGLLSFYTRDFRLANLTPKQFEYCRYYSDLAATMLQENMIRPFLICISRVAAVLELSQSVGGFLRKQENTITTEQKQELVEPQKKDLLGRVKNK